MNQQPPMYPPPPDARAAKAEAKAAKARAKALRPWYKKKRLWVLAAIVVLVIISIASAGNKTTTASSGPANNGGVASLSDNHSHPPQADVEIGSCATDSQIGTTTAHLVITNHSSGRSNYLIDVEFQDASGAQVGSGTAVANNVDAGQVAKTDAVDFVTATTCVIKNVNRFAS